MWRFEQLIEAVKALGTAPWRQLLRLAAAGSEPPPAGLAVPPFAADWREALEHAGAFGGLPPAGASHLPLLGEVPWSIPGSWTTDPGSEHDFGDGPSRAVRARPDVPDADLLRAWVRGRLSEAHHAALRAALADESSAFAGELVADFTRRNPPGRGPHWATAMEVALRAVRLLHARALVPSEEAAPFDEALHAHEAWLARATDWRLHYTGNHYLVELAGRFLLAACLQETSARRRERKRSWSLFWREWRRQVGPDGMHFESATAYHLLAMEVAAHVVAVGARAGLRPSPRSAERLRIAAEATTGLLREDGTVARIGDGDDGRFLDLPVAAGPPVPEDASAVAGLLAVASACDDLRHRCRSWPTARAAVAVLFGRDGLAALDDAAPSQRRWPRCFAWGGLATLATRDGSVHVTVSATDVGRGTTGGHAHDDAGSFVLWAGRPVVVDRGTGNYTGDPAMRERYRCVAAHSVSQVDGRDQNPPVPGRPFRVVDRARPFLVGFRRDEGGGAVEVGHHGFMAGPGCVSVLRRLAVDDGGALTVDDDLRGRGEHDVVVRIQWAADLRPTGSGDVVVAETADGERVASVRLEARGPDDQTPPMKVVQVPCKHSPRMGEEVDAVVTEVRIRSALPLRVRQVLERG